eukprot:5905276-Lingulodinium_polyedra.AAC.1
MGETTLVNARARKKEHTPKQSPIGKHNIFRQPDTRLPGRTTNNKSQRHALACEPESTGDLAKCPNPPGKPRLQPKIQLHTHDDNTPTKPTQRQTNANRHSNQTTTAPSPQRNTIVNGNANNSNINAN